MKNKYLFYIMGGYQCDKSVNKIDSRGVIWYHSTAVKYDITFNVSWDCFAISWIKWRLQKFVYVSDKEISRFFQESENKNTARKTAQDVALIKSFLTRKKKKLKNKKNWHLSSWKEFLEKQDGSNYEPSLKDIRKKKSYGYSIINSIIFAGTREVLKLQQKR